MKYERPIKYNKEGKTCIIKDNTGKILAQITNEKVANNIVKVMNERKIND